MNRSIPTALLFLLALPVTAAPSSRPAIVELYTSEGCSSCPPAEALLEELARRPGVLPLAFHVDYWDGLGWRDRYSMKEASARQEDFARTLRLTTTGTPQFIIDGRDSVWGVRRADLAEILEKPRVDVPFSAQLESDELVVRVPASSPEAAIYGVYVVGYLPRAVTAIQRGENAGRTLTEVNIVRGIRRLGRSVNRAEVWRIPVDTLPKDATRVAVLLQREADGAIVGARDVAVRGAGVSGSTQPRASRSTPRPG